MTTAIPIDENIYSLALALMRDGAEIDGLEGVREQLKNAVDRICDGIQYGENDEER